MNKFRGELQKGEDMLRDCERCVDPDYDYEDEPPQTDMMTPDEQTLSDAMHKVCGVADQSQLDNYATRQISHGITATLKHGLMYIEYFNGGGCIIINAQTFQALTRFAEQIGWQCD